jgi:hypothetical protein
MRRLAASALPVLLATQVALLLAPAGAAADEPRPAGDALPGPPSRAVPWGLPEAGRCEPAGGIADFGRADAPPVPFASGESVGIAELELLRDFLPEEVWDQRERFFYEGMRLVIGSCFADYSAPPFFQVATQTFAGQATLTDDGGLANYTAGLPFPPALIDPGDPQAAAKWAWNHELRYQGAGFRGVFRTSDMVGRDGRAEPFIGEIFKVQLAFRSDRADASYTAPGSKDKHWVGGGLMKEPFDARHYAWRQYRDVEHLVDADRSDDLHAYLPDHRRVRRVPAAGVEGVYMPSFNVGMAKPGTLAGIGGAYDGGVGGAQGVAAAPPSSITTRRSGFEGLELRPLLWTFELLGVRDVLTPLNATTPSFPDDPQREFGPWGLSFASDTWDLRRAVVLRARSRKADVGGDQVAHFLLHIDAQTQQPLYYVSFDSRDELIDVGLFVGRWSEGRPAYPPWPDDPQRPVRVIDPVGAAFANIAEGGGWRRESWAIVSTPPDDRTLKRELSVSDLTRRN